MSLSPSELSCVLYNVHRIHGSSVRSLGLLGEVMDSFAPRFHFYFHLLNITRQINESSCEYLPGLLYDCIIRAIFCIMGVSGDKSHLRAGQRKNLNLCLSYLMLKHCTLRGCCLQEKDMLTCMCARKFFPQSVLSWGSPCQVQNLWDRDPEFRMIYECHGERMFATEVFLATRTCCVFTSNSAIQVPQQQCGSV